jgi:uncharacterized protein
MPADPPNDSKAAGKPCPECGKPANPKTLPFCSPRCRDVDLHRWFSGTYVVPGREDDEENAD